MKLLNLNATAAEKELFKDFGLYLTKVEKNPYRRVYNYIHNMKNVHDNYLRTLDFPIALFPGLEDIDATKQVTIYRDKGYGPFDPKIEVTDVLRGSLSLQDNEGLLNLCKDISRNYPYKSLDEFIEDMEK